MKSSQLLLLAFLCGCETPDYGKRLVVYVRDHGTTDSTQTAQADLANRWTNIFLMAAAQADMGLRMLNDVLIQQSAALVNPQTSTPSSDDTLQALEKLDLRLATLAQIAVREDELRTRLDELEGTCDSRALFNKLGINALGDISITQVIAPRSMYWKIDHSSSYGSSSESQQEAQWLYTAIKSLLNFVENRRVHEQNELLKQAARDFDQVKIQGEPLFALSAEQCHQALEQLSPQFQNMKSTLTSLSEARRFIEARSVEEKKLAQNRLLQSNLDTILKESGLAREMARLAVEKLSGDLALSIAAADRDLSKFLNAAQLAGNCARGVQALEDLADAADEWRLEADTYAKLLETREDYYRVSSAPVQVRLLLNTSARKLTALQARLKQVGEALPEISAQASKRDCQ